MYAEKAPDPLLSAVLAPSPPTLDAQALGDIIGRLRIPPCPQVLQALMAEIRAESVDFHRVVRLISGDVSLAAAMIRAANSPLFALRHKVQNVQQAVTILGLKQVIQMVAGIELERSLSTGIRMERFWERSNLHAVTCAALTRHCRSIAPEDAYTFGLFHDCGIPILMQHFPDYKQTLARANHASRPVPEVEYEQHGTSHVVVGALLAAEWQLTGPLLDAIRNHHDPILLEDKDEPPPVRTLIALAILADHLVARFLQVEDEAEWFAWGLQAMDYLGFDTPFVDQAYPDIARQMAETLAARGGT
ncbi:HDOD domain-containing protein [Azovibrio restrictus]|uniref:HDOD domain-containing protein n=1 Tax=Azovibrio restrictus TaxID=146938 RepID=UPI0026EB9971|nr:HDOD domain-containing protein [Azovibrio restrictus]